MNGALETVKSPGLGSFGNCESPIVLIATCIARCHDVLPYFPIPSPITGLTGHRCPHLHGMTAPELIARVLIIIPGDSVACRIVVAHQIGDTLVGVLGGPEYPVSAGAPGVHHPSGDPFRVKVGNFLLN